MCNKDNPRQYHSEQLVLTYSGVKKYNLIIVLDLFSIVQRQGTLQQYNPMFLVIRVNFPMCLLLSLSFFLCKNNVRTYILVFQL